MKPSLMSGHSGRRRAAVTALVLCFASASAWAISATAVDDVPLRGAARSSSTLVTPARSSAAAPAQGLALVRARLDAVDLAKGQLTFGGHVLALHPSQLRVVSPAGQRLGGADALRPGMWLRFAREGLPAGTTAVAATETDELARRIVLIYIER